MDLQRSATASAAVNMINGGIYQYAVFDMDRAAAEEPTLLGRNRVQVRDFIPIASSKSCPPGRTCKVQSRKARWRNSG